MAAFDPARRTANIIMGSTEDQETDVRLTVRNLDRASELVRGGQVRLLAARIPNTETAPLEKPQLVRDEPMPVLDNQLQILLPKLGAGGVYAVRLDNPALQELQR